MKKFFTRDCEAWKRNKSVNPVTKKKISPNGKVHKLYDIMCNELYPKLGKDFELISYYYDPVLILFLDDLEAMDLREGQLKKMVKYLRNVKDNEQFYDVLADKQEELESIKEIQKERVPQVIESINKINVYNKKLLDKNIITVNELLKQKLNPENYQGRAREVVEMLY